MEKYEKLLDNIYENLPKESSKEERFEVPEFSSFIEGNKTIVSNFGEVASKLRRDKELLVKFLSRELATPAQMDKERLILQRKVQPQILNKKLQEFVKEYVVCNTCGKPDTHIRSTGQGIRELVCEACGSRRAIR